jgi:cyclophilin family peptidyl-prolyl cis-trans isomerase
MKKVRSIITLGLLISLAAVSMAACSKVKPLTEAASIAPTETAAVKSWTTPPAMTIDVNKKYSAVVKTTKGSFTLELFAQDAPKTVNNFVFLARAHFYDGIIFHRIMETFMIQTGDPEGTGRGGPGYQFEDELNNLHEYEQGIVAMANAGPNTNGSQFFICTVDDRANLEKKYSTFAKVTTGMDTVLSIAKTPVGADGQTPTEKVMIESVQIIEQ